MNELEEIKKVDKRLLDKIEHILASELSCKEYDIFYNYFNEIRKPNILIDIKDDENIKELITNLQSKIDKAIEYIETNKHFEWHTIRNEKGKLDTTKIATDWVSGNKILDILKEDK